MGIKDFFNVSKIKAENEQLKLLMTPELKEGTDLLKKIAELKEQVGLLEQAIEKKTAALDSEIQDKNKKLLQLTTEIAEKKDQIITFDESILVQDFGLYNPRFSYATSDEFKDDLKLTRIQQKECIKNGSAVTGNMNFTYNNSAAQGKKVVKDMQKLLMRAFNSECDETISKVKYNNYEMSLKKITASYENISKLGKMLSICITPEYFKLKERELMLTLEYQIKKQEEKEALKQARAEMREQAKLQKELDDQRRKIEKEQSHYQKALLSLLKQLEQDKDNADLNAKKEELESQLGLIDSSLNDLDYREANQRAGYVYIISNVGSFGENVYKIGMTRRLEPLDRIDELGSASVPFNFDVHAMIFTDDAPKLENSLHKAFEKNKINLVNGRREFFHVTLDEIKEVIMKNFDKTVEFIDIPDAEQYRISEKLRAEF